jgi:hypothetical protein
MLASAGSASASPVETDRSFVGWMTAGGAGVGLALDLFYLFTIQTGYEPDSSPLLRGSIITATSLIQLATATAAFWGIARLITALKPSWWQAALAAPLYGAVSGAISFGLFMGTAFGIGVPTGAITINPQADFWPASVDTWYEAFGRGFAGGASFGALFGAIVATVVAPVATLVYQRMKQ